MERALVLLHGFPFEGSYWQPQAEGLSAACRVLAPDLRGFGADRRALPTALTMEQLADDVLADMDAAGVKRATIGGLSMGGYVAMALAARSPERVDALVLCNTRATADDAEGRAAREKTALDALEHGPQVIARAMLPKLLSEQSQAQRPELVRRIESMIARQRPEAIAAASRGMALRPDRFSLLRGWTKPALVITGAHDTLMPLPTSVAMRDAMPGSRLIVLPDAAHLSSAENPAAFNQALLDFMNTYQ
ncbi:MAG: alpha/beta fold hydrolase [Flavobacteriales bacterium]|nr:alpha/beta fold hydrolase [Flavobacteriales bacterium]